MSKTKKGWLITAALLTVIGLLLFACAFSVLGFDVKKLSTVKPVTNTYEIKDDFDKIIIDVNTADVEILASEDGTCRVVCEESEKVSNNAVVENGTLKITVSDTRGWYERMSFNFYSMKVTAYIPEKEYSSISVKVDTGNVDVISQKVKDGIDINTSTGNILFDNVTVSGTLNSKSSTGNVIFEDSDAGEIYVRTSTGNVSGTLLSEKIFYTDTSTGNVNVPKSTSGGICEIKTSTGNIDIKIK